MRRWHEITGFHEMGTRGCSLATVVALALLGWGCSKARDGQKPPGPVREYRPVHYYDHIRRDCGPDCQILEMKAKGVSSDGVMDLTGSALVEYEFRKPRKPGDTTGKRTKTSSKSKSSSKRSKDSNSSRQGKKTKKRSEKRSWGGGRAGKAKGFERVIIQIPGIGGSRRADKIVMARKSAPHNVKRTVAITTAGPKCELAGLWKTALAKGADANALATVTYDRDGYHFEIDQPRFEMWFDFACAPMWQPEALVKPVEDFEGVLTTVPRDAEFLGFTAQRVRSDGTADTSADPDWVRYRFLYEKPLKNAEEIQVWLRSGGIRRDRRFLPLDSKPVVAPPPSCPLADLWQKAIAKGADESRPARFEYDKTGYVFRQDEPRTTLKFDASCKLAE